MSPTRSLTRSEATGDWLPPHLRLVARICGLYEPLILNRKPNRQAAQSMNYEYHVTPRGSRIIYAKSDTGVEFEGFVDIPRTGRGGPERADSGATHP